MGGERLVVRESSGRERGNKRFCAQVWIHSALRDSIKSTKGNIKGTVIQIEKALINDCLRI